MYVVSTLAHGEEFYVDLCNCFGWRPSEWGWQTVLAVILWHLRDVRGLFAYVDNFFVFSAPSADHSAAIRMVTSELASIGTPLHEVQCGHRIKALGWWFDASHEDFGLWCTEDRWTVYCDYLSVWKNASVLSLADVRKAVGLFQYISTVWTIGKADVAALIGLRTRGDGMLSRSNRISPSSLMLVLPAPAREAFAFWGFHFPKWNRRGTVFCDFGPCSPPELVGAVDASTDWGAGVGSSTTGLCSAISISGLSTSALRLSCLLAKVRECSRL